jgi:MFS family permease
MLWLVSSSGMCCSFIIWTGLNSKFASTQDPMYGRAVLAFVFIFSFFFTIGNSPMAYAYTIEIYPYTLRGRGLSFSITITMAGLILGQFMNPRALDGIGWKYYIVFCVLLGIFFILVWFLFPETKGRTLEEIAEIFDGKPLESTQTPLKVDHDLDQFEGDRKEAIAKAEASEFRNI